MSDWIDKLDRNVFPFVEYPGYDQRYPAIEGMDITPSMAAEIREASGKLYKIFQKACNVAQYGGNKFLSDLEIPRKLWPYLDIPNPLGLPTWLSRFDFVFDEHRRLKLCELNADTPCALIEAFYANEIYCKEHFRTNPNEGEREKLKKLLLKIFHESVQTAADLGSGRLVAAKPFVFACFPDYIEDYGTTKYLMNAMMEAVNEESPVVPVGESIRFASFYDIRVDKDTGDCVIPDGTFAGGLYRMHPLEILVDEESDDGYPIGTRLLDGHENGRFLMLNPSEAILMQSKAFQALVWSLHLDGRFYDEEEQHAIEEYMLPTYFEENDCEKDVEYIEKPIWGREGLGIRTKKNGKIVLEKKVPDDDEIVRRDSLNTVFQEFVHQPSMRFLTDEGNIKGYVTISCFMLGDKPSALYARFSPEQIAGTEAYWLPLAY